MGPLLMITSVGGLSFRAESKLEVGILTHSHLADLGLLSRKLWAIMRSLTPFHRGQYAWNKSDSSGGAQEALVIIAARHFTHRHPH